MRRIAHALTFLLVLVALLACTSPVKRSHSETSSGSASLASRQHPPDFTLKSASSRQAAMQGAYYWQLDNGRVSESIAKGFSVTGMTPLNVLQGDQLTVVATNGSYPETMDLKIYPEDGNLRNVTNNAVTAPAFVPATPPLAEQRFSNSPYDLEIDLPAGHYFIWMSGSWPNPFKSPAATITSAATPSGTPPPTPLTDTIAFWINVQS